MPTVKAEDEGQRNVFLYGTLMYPSILSRVIPGRYQQEVGFANGFRRLKVIGEDYPGLIPDSDALSPVQGVILYRVSPPDLALLDSFEAECYVRTSITIQDEASQDIPADVYMVRPDHYDLLSDKEWDLKVFERQGLKRFSAEYYGFK